MTASAAIPTDQDHQETRTSTACEDGRQGSCRRSVRRWRGVLHHDLLPDVASAKSDARGRELTSISGGIESVSVTLNHVWTTLTPAGRPCSASRRSPRTRRQASHGGNETSDRRQTAKPDGFNLGTARSCEGRSDQRPIISACRPRARTSWTKSLGRTSSGSKSTIIRWR